MTASSHDALLERARNVIRELREKLVAAEARSQPEPIAVTGMALRFPGCGENPEQFWQMIAEGRDSVAEIPADRWDRDAYYAAEAPTPAKINTRHASFLDDVRRFDASFFDVAPIEAVAMDPQQRIFMETAWHALEDAALTKDSLAGSDTGVFVGVHTQSIDYLSMQFEDPASLNTYSATGTAHDVIAGRLAYWLDLQGPAVVVNTACSSSLVAVHLACRSLRAGDCTVALAAGVNLLLAPPSSVAMSQLQLLSPDGRCKTFDARADGMGRGEGCGVIVLKKLSDARRDGDRILAVVRGSAINHDGKTNGLTAPNGLAQQRMLRRALEDAGLDEAAVGYVETHGTGTSLGDPIEVEALGEVLGRAEKRTSPLTLGAVKANIGHLEGAAGIAGLIKAIMVLQHRWIPPVANLGRLNPHLALEDAGIEIPRQGREWISSQPRIAGVSSFGWSGTNSHVILEEAQATTATEIAQAEWPILISAQSVEALRALALEFCDLLEGADAAALASISYTSTVRHTHHALRMAVIGSDGRELAVALRQRITSLSTETRRESGRRGPLSEQIRIWEAGGDVDWRKFVSVAPVTTLPRYPFQGRDYWIETKPKLTPQSLAVQDEQRFEEWFYKTEWIEKALDSAKSKLDVAVILRWETSDVTVLAEALRERGIRVIDVLRGSSYRSLTDDRFVAGDEVAEDIVRILAALFKDGIGVCEVLYFAGDQSAEQLVADALAVSASLCERVPQSKIRFVTRNADGPGRVGGMNMQSTLRGFSRVLGLEYPELAAGLIDADLGDGANVAALCDELEATSKEDRIALRGGHRWVPRIRRDSPAAPVKALELSPAHSYLVTGAFGGLGVEIASWLVSRGARHLVLLGRRPIDETGNTRLLQHIENWRAQGITVLAESCDVGEESQVQRVLDDVSEKGFPLAGVIHAAARLLMHPIPEFKREDIHEAFYAKVDGALVLDRLTRPLDLTFFVLFSSAAATIGMRNGALYAAANSCLDEIVRERRDQNQAALCVEWGSWKYEGADEQRVLIGRSGFEEMSPAHALKAMEQLLQSNIHTGLVGAIDWSVLGPALEMRARQHLIEDLLVDRSAATKDRTSSKGSLSPEDLAGLSKEDRADRVCDFVGAEVRRVFGMYADELLDESRGLFQMGMDSLMSVRLKRALEAGTGLRLPGTLTLMYPSVSAIAAFLEEKLVPPVPAPIGEMQAAKMGRESVSVSAMDDDETNAAIAAELASIQKLGVL